MVHTLCVTCSALYRVCTAHRTPAPVIFTLISKPASPKYLIYKIMSRCTLYHAHSTVYCRQVYPFRHTGVLCTVH